MKVKVIKANLDSYWYADNIGKVYDVEEVQLNNHSNLEYKVIGSELGGTKYFDKDDVEILKQNSMFDMKKDRWFIRTPTPEISAAVQEWLFEKGFGWQSDRGQVVQYTDTNYLMLSPYEDGRFCHTSCIDARLKEKEIKVTIKPAVDSVYYPEIETPEQKQLEEVMDKISDLQKQAEILQGMIGKSSK